MVAVAKVDVTVKVVAVVAIVKAVAAMAKKDKSCGYSFSILTA